MNNDISTFIVNIPDSELEDLRRRLSPFLAKTPYAGEDLTLLRKAVKILQPRLVTLVEIGERLSLFFAGLSYRKGLTMSSNSDINSVPLTVPPLDFNVLMKFCNKSR